MPKARVTFTISPADAERLREAAGRARVTVSAYIERAVVDAVRHDEVLRDTFAPADSAAAAACAAADAVIWPEPESLSPARKAELDTILHRSLGRFPHSA